MKMRTAWPNNAIVHHEANQAGRDLVTGDVHGYLDTLEFALDQLGFDPVSDRLFSVGDLVDRGPRSPDALEWLERGRIAAVRGNHEQMMMRALALEGGERHKSGAGAHWADNGGGWWWGCSDEFADEHGMPLGPDHNERLERWLDALAKVPILRTIETRRGSVGIVHTRASAGACTVASTMTRASSPTTISMRPDAAPLDGSGASTTTGTNPPPLCAGVRYRRRHLNNTLV